MALKLSHEEIRQLLAGTLNKNKGDDDQFVWTIQVFDETFVYEDDGETFQASYTIDDDGVATIGEPERVKVEYVKFAALENVDVLKVGTFTDMAGNEITFTSDDLDQVLSNFNELKDNKVPMVVGHNEGDESVMVNALTVGAPVVGYMASVKRVGDILKATFTDIAEKAEDMMGKTLVRVSPEVFNNFKDNDGNAHGKAFRRISLIGRSAIQGLGDITGDNLAFSENEPGQETSVILLHENVTEPTSKKEKKDMDPKLKAALDAICGVDASPEAQAAALVKLQESVGTLTDSEQKAAKALTDSLAGQKKDKIDGFLTKLTEAGKLAPAHKEAGLSAFMTGLDDSPAGILKFGEGDIETSKTPLQYMMDMLDGATPLVKLSEVASGGGPVKDDAITPEQAEMNKKLGVSSEAHTKFSAGPASTEEGDK